MSKYDSPDPPDPNEVAGAQGAQNRSTAMANAAMGMVNRRTPDYALTYNQIGTFDYTDPNTGETVSVPRFSAIEELHPFNEDIWTANKQAQIAGARTAKDQMQWLRPYMTDRSYLNTDTLPQRVSPPPVRGMYQHDPQWVPPAAQNNIEGGPVQSGVGTTNVQTTLGGMNPIQGQFQAPGVTQATASGGQIRRNVSGPRVTQATASGGNVQRNVGNPRVTQAAARQGGIQWGMDNPQINTEAAQGGAIRRQVADAGQLQGRFAQGGGLTRNVAPSQFDMRGTNVGPTQRQISTTNTAGQLANEQADGGDITRTYGTDFSEDRQRVEDALMQRMQRYIDRDREGMRTRLANQGISLGSDAFTDAQQDFQRGVNDARLGAILSAGQEQSRLVGMEANRARFQNAAQGQAFGQDMANLQRRDQLQGQEFSQALAGGQFANQAQNQAFQQQFANRQAQNALRSERFGQGMANAQLRNQAQGQAFGQDMANLQRSDAQQAQRFSQNLAGAQFGNQAQQQAFGQDLANFESQAARQGQQFQQNLATGQFRNQAQQQRFGQDLANIESQAARQGQQFGQNVTAGQFRNAAQDQVFGQGLANIDSLAARQGQQFGQNLAGAQFANQAQGQQFGQNLSNIESLAGRQGQQFSQNLAGAQFGNQAQQQQFNQALGAGQFANQAADQRFQQGLQAGQFANQAQQQDFMQNLARREREDTQRQREFDNRMNFTDAANTQRLAQFGMAQEQAAMQNQLRQQALQERFALRNQPLNEIAALLSGSQVAQPNFPIYQPGGMPTTDIAGLMQSNYKTRSENAQAANEARSALFGNLASAAATLGSAFISDARKKTDIRRIGNRDGLGVYVYRYKHDPPGVRRVGYMAQEVAQVRPDAVVRMGDWLGVDYAKLPEVA